MDSLNIRALSVATRIGVHAWEQKINQTLLIDITVPTDFRACADTLADTLDYDDLCKTVTHFVESNSFQLIETVANSVAELVKSQFKIEKITVAVSKPHAVKNAGTIQVTVSR